MKQVLIGILIAAITITNFTGFVSADSSDYSIPVETEKGEYLLELYSENGVAPEDTGIPNDMVVTNITGFFEFNDQIINFWEAK